MPRRNLTTPIQLPPDAPPAVVEAHERHDKLLTDLAKAEGERDDCKAQIETARQQDLDDAVAAAEAGRAPAAKLGKHEAAARQNLERAERQIAGLRIAADRAALPLLEAIEKHAPKWATQQHKREQAAEDELRDLLARTSEAARELGSARAAVAWLTGFTCEDFLRGGPIFHGRGRLAVEDDRRLQRRGELTVGTLLEVARTAIEPDTKSEMRGPLTGQPRRRFEKAAA
jgi:hypothetical protein